MLKLTIAESIKTLADQNQLFVRLFKHGTLEIEIYKPHRIDLQKPHTRDEVYVIAQGIGQFECAGEGREVAPGDTLFVPAGVDHRFSNFSEDFATWVFFYGPEGGETE